MALRRASLALLPLVLACAAAQEVLFLPSVQQVVLKNGASLDVRTESRLNGLLMLQCFHSWEQREACLAAEDPTACVVAECPKALVGFDATPHSAVLTFTRAAAADGAGAAPQYVTPTLLVPEGAAGSIRIVDEEQQQAQAAGEAVITPEPAAADHDAKITPDFDDDDTAAAAAATTANNSEGERKTEQEGAPAAFISTSFLPAEHDARITPDFDGANVASATASAARRLLRAE